MNNLEKKNTIQNKNKKVQKIEVILNVFKLMCIHFPCGTKMHEILIVMSYT